MMIRPLSSSIGSQEVAAAAAVTKAPVPAPYYTAPSKFDKDVPEST